MKNLFFEKQKTIVVIALWFAFLITTCGAEPASDRRPIDWAHSVQMRGVPNFYQVSDNLYRSGWPTAEALQHLKSSKWGIRTVVDLCLSQSNEQEFERSGLVYQHIPMVGWPLFPKEEQVVKFLQIVTDTQKAPVLVHCQHGADRTGAMCAVYRIAVQGWTKERALEEMVEGGFGFHGFRDGNVVQWIKHLDIGKIRRKAGIPQSTPPIATKG